MSLFALLIKELLSALPQDTGFSGEASRDLEPFSLWVILENMLLQIKIITFRLELAKSFNFV